MTTRGLLPAVVLLAALTLVSCVAEPGSREVVIGEPAVAEEPTPPQAGWTCPNGPVDCDFGLGCWEGYCGGCDDPDQCRSTEGCRSDFTCGACSADADCRAGEVCQEGFCLADEPPGWDITVAPEDLALIQEDHWAETYVPAWLRVDDVVYGPAELRLYGGSSRSRPKSSFRLRFPEDVEHPGFSRKINLRAEYNDASYLRTFLGYETFRRLTRMPVPRARYLGVSINGEFYGLMLEVERLGGRFLEANGRDREQSLYEAQQDWPSGAMTPIRTEDGWRYVWDKKTGVPEDYSDLQAFVEDVLWEDLLSSPSLAETTLERTRESLDVDSYVDYMAVMTLLQNQDHITNNFYVSYQSVLGDAPKWEVYPYDLDLTFGCNWSPDEGTICSEFSWDRWWLNGVIVDADADYCWCNLAMHLALNEELAFARYRQRICSFTASDWWTGQGEGLAEALGVRLESQVAEDDLDRLESLFEWELAREEVGRFFELRSAYLRTQLACE